MKCEDETCWGCQLLAERAQKCSVYGLVNASRDRCSLYRRRAPSKVQEPSVEKTPRDLLVGNLVGHPYVDQALCEIKDIACTVHNNSKTLSSQQLLKYREQLDDLFKQVKIFLRIGNYRWSVCQRVWHDVSDWTPQQIASLDLMNQREGMRLVELQTENRRLQRENEELKERLESTDAAVSNLCDQLIENNRLHYLSDVVERLKRNKRPQN